MIRKMNDEKELPKVHPTEFNIARDSRQKWKMPKNATMHGEHWFGYKPND